MTKGFNFDWLDDTDNSMVLLETHFSKILATKLKDKYLSNKKITEIIGNEKPYYQIKNSEPIRVKTLRKVITCLDLNSINISKNINYYNDKSPFTFKFPIDLDRKESAILIGAFMSDGNNNANHPFYCNKGCLKDKILNAVQTMLPRIPWEIRNEKHLRFHPVVSRTLLKLGVPIGDKILLNPKIPKFIYRNKIYKKEYLTQVFDDEGHAATRASRKIVMGRNVAVKNLPKNFVSILTYKKTRYLKEIPLEIKKIIDKQPPNLLKGEQELLIEFGIKSSMRLRCITKYLDRVSASWVIEISGKKNIEKFNNKIGFSHPDKIKKMKKYLEGYT